MAFRVRNLKLASGGAIKSPCRLAGRPTVSYSMLAARSAVMPVLNIASESATTPTIFSCGSKVILSGVNGNVIMSGCGNDNPDDEG